MAKDFSLMEDSNRSSNPSIHDVSDPQRRIVLRGGAMAAALSLLGPLAGCASMGAAASGPKLGFKGIPAGVGDKLVVPEGHRRHRQRGLGRTHRHTGKHARLQI